MVNPVADDLFFRRPKKMNEKKSALSQNPVKISSSFIRVDEVWSTFVSLHSSGTRSVKWETCWKKIAERPPAALNKSLTLLRKLYIFCIAILLASHPNLPRPPSSPWPLYPKWETVGAIFCPKIHYKLEEPLSREKEIEWEKNTEQNKK